MAGNVSLPATEPQFSVGTRYLQLVQLRFQTLGVPAPSGLD